MKEYTLAKSIKSRNYFIIAALIIFLGGFTYGEINSYDPIYYCIHPWAFSFYYVWPSVALAIIGIVYNGTEIIITNKRAHGKSLFGKHVDLPLDSISAVGSFWPRGICIATSSGKVEFAFIKNRDEIYKCISNLLIERQTKQAEAKTINQEFNRSGADELKKYKGLLDDGIISQEEFDAKKKQLLGL